MRKPLSACKFPYAARSFRKASRIQRSKTSLPPPGGERGREAVQGAAVRCPEPPPVAKRPAGPPPGPAAAAHSPLRAALCPRRSAAAVPSRPSEPRGTRSCRRRRDLGHPARRLAKVRRRRRRRKASGGAAYRRARGEAAAGPEPAPRGEKGAGEPREPTRAWALPARRPAPSQRRTPLSSRDFETCPPPPSPRPCQGKAIPVCATVVRLRSHVKAGNISKVLRSRPARVVLSEPVSFLHILPTDLSSSVLSPSAVYPEGFWSSKFQVS